MRLKELVSSLSRNGIVLPDDYICIDIETTGLSPEKDFIVQIGHCLVSQGQVVDSCDFFVDWTKSTDRTKLTTRDIDFIQQSLSRVSSLMKSRGKNWQIDWNTLCHKGDCPIEVFESYTDLFSYVQKENLPVVAHNGYKFDVPFIDKFLRRCFSNYPFVKNAAAISKTFLIDTGALIKAAQLPTTMRPGEQLNSFYKRVVNAYAPNISWSLNEFAVPYFQLDRRGCIDTFKAHTSSYDAYVCSLLLEEIKHRSNREESHELGETTSHCYRH